MFLALRNVDFGVIRHACDVIIETKTQEHIMQKEKTHYGVMDGKMMS